ncbi:MAG: hypothetical protein COB53_09910 [Elusimicrobia bacterium]|nr:MAG: hypothetical protein COB53_09910 [Elusimicrobiota bacterium]
MHKILALVLVFGLAAPASARFRLRLPSFKGVFNAQARPVLSPALVDSSLPLVDLAVTRREAVDALGYDPLKQNYFKLTNKGKEGWSDVAEIDAPKDKGPNRVVKRTNPESARNEVAVRSIIRRFPIFSDSFETPAAFHYTEWGDSKRTVVMEKSEGYRSLNGWIRLPVNTKAALAVLGHVLGIDDMNTENILFNGNAAPELIDLEWAFARSTPRLAYDRTPWVNAQYLHDYADYKDAVEAWTVDFARPETREMIYAILVNAGFNPEEALQRLAVITDNSSRLEALVRADVDNANKRFYEEAKRGGLDANEALMLSAVNKAGRYTKEGRKDLDLIRIALAESGMHPAQMGRFRESLEPKAWKEFLRLHPDSPDGATLAARLGEATGRHFLHWAKDPAELERAIGRVAERLKQ